MELCIISPTVGLERYATLSHRHLVLAHINDEDYKQFYYQRRVAGDFLILDNGAHEKGEAVEWRQLESAIAYYKPQVVVLPDILNDGRRTLSSSLRFLDRNVDRWECQWMFVPQGESWHYDFLSILEDSRVGHLVSWIGVNRYLSINQDLNRVQVAKMIKGNHPHLHLHALGMVKGDVREFKEVRDSQLFESLDTSVPVWRGMCGYQIDDPSWPEISVDFLSGRPVSELDMLIKSNLEALNVNTTKL